MVEGTFTMIGNVQPNYEPRTGLFSCDASHLAPNRPISMNFFFVFFVLKRSKSHKHIEGTKF